jgi:uncharacterized protein YaiE (UPF0345 family)
MFLESEEQMRKTLFFTVLWLFLPAVVVTADIPKLINYQGMLTQSDGTTPVEDGAYDVVFKIYASESGNDSLWSESHLGVQVTNGLFGVMLGSVNLLDVPFDTEYWLEITVDGETMPRFQLTSVGYAFHAKMADTASAAVTATAGGGWADDGGVVRLETGTDKVGIGTTNPRVKLSLGTDFTAKKFALWDGVDDFYGLGVGIGRIIFHTNDTEKMTILANGNVGIGTAAPSTESRVHIRADSDNFGLLVDAEGASGSEIGLHTATSKYASLVKNAYFAGGWHRLNVSSGAFLQEIVPGGDVQFKVIGAGENPIVWKKPLTLKTDGKVGIGTINPQTELHVYTADAGDATTLRLENWGDVYFDLTADNGALDFSSNTHSNVLVLKSGNVGVGTTSPNEKLHVNGTAKCSVLKLTGGSDIAEPFDVSGEMRVKPGMVLVIDAENPGKLKISEKAYDRCVAGIISGAGSIEPGMLMGQTGSVADGEYPVALTGRVYCRADAANGAIRPGDLLTTSDTFGHAMKVTDYAKAQGAVIGKALTSLQEGQGLVLVLVALQ